jgi:catechol-2,3-dioxygenase
MALQSPVRELRLAVTAQDYEESLSFYRDVLGLPVLKSWDEPTAAARSSTPAVRRWSCCRPIRPT